MLSLDGAGKGYFAIASAPGDHGLEFLIKKGNGVSGALFDSGVGSSVFMSGPVGKGFPVETYKGHDVLMMAAGVEMGNANEDSGRDADALVAAKVALTLRAGEINTTNRAGDTALHGAIARVSPDIAMLLIERGARLDAKNKRGLMPIDLALGGLAVDGSRPDLAQKLREMMLARGLTVPALKVDADHYKFGVQIKDAK